jgi:hypothetical protein
METLFWAVLIPDWLTMELEKMMVLMVCLWYHISAMRFEIFSKIRLPCWKYPCCLLNSQACPLYCVYWWHRVPEHLMYVEWYTPLLDNPEHNHLLYKVLLQKDRDGMHICSIISLANICCNVHLYPKFGAFASQDWLSGNVLDQCNTFFINDFTDRHMYRIAC